MVKVISLAMILMYALTLTGCSQKPRRSLVDKDATPYIHAPILTLDGSSSYADACYHVRSGGKIASSRRDSASASGTSENASNVSAHDEHIAEAMDANPVESETAYAIFYLDKNGESFSNR